MTTSAVVLTLNVALHLARMQFDVNYSQHRSEAFAPKLAATSSGSREGMSNSSSHTVVRAAAWSPLNLKSLVFWGMNFESQGERLCQTGWHPRE